MCYQNAILQCLSNTKRLVHFSVNGYKTLKPLLEKHTSSQDLTTEYIRLMEGIWRPKDTGLAPTLSAQALLSCLSKYTVAFNNDRQQDTHEYLVHLLHAMHAETNLSAQTDKESSTQRNMSWKKYLERNDSVVTASFDGYTRSNITCLVRRHNNVSLDPFRVLSLPIPQGTGAQVGLDDCLSCYFEEERLEGDDRPMCKKCSKVLICSRIQRIQNFPEVIIINLMRFRDGKKLTTEVSCPAELDLCDFSTRANCKDALYTLYAACCHNGTTEKGHYTAIARNPISGKWHLFDDERIEAVEMKDEWKTADAYVLFYQTKKMGVCLSLLVSDYTWGFNKNFPAHQHG